jgi:membrane fusion protein, multidrug efflux system
MTLEQMDETENNEIGADRTPSPMRQQPRPKPRWRRYVAVVLGLACLAYGGVRLQKYIVFARAHESTDDAFIEARVVQIGTKLAGYVDSVAVQDNEHVTRGQLLVKLDARDQQAKLEQAKASLAATESRLIESRTQLGSLKAKVAEAQAEIAAAQANLDHAQTDLKRYESMASGAASPQERSNALSTAQAAEANLAAARSKAAAAEASVASGVSHVNTVEADVAMARTQVAQAELDLTYTTIAAPESGRITRKSVERGAYLQAGQALMAIVPDDVWVVANFKETQLTDMRPGQSVEVHVDAYSGRTLKAHVDSIQAGTGSRFSLLPPENATGNYVKVVQRVPVKIVFDGKLPEDLVLAPGMSVVPEVNVK